MLVEGPPGPEGPAVSGIFPLLWLGMLSLGSVAPICHARAHRELWGGFSGAKNKQRAQNLFLPLIEICYK